MSEYIIDTVNMPEHVRSIIGLWVIESVVRCRDCKFCGMDDIGFYCSLFNFGYGNSMENMFCAWAERKDR